MTEIRQAANPALKEDTCVYSPNDVLTVDARRARRAKQRLLSALVSKWTEDIGFLVEGSVW